MLVLVLTALVCGWATYKFHSQSKRAILQRAGYAVYHSLRQARTLACREHRLCVVEMDFSNQTFRIRSLQGDIPVAPAAETPEKTESAPRLEKEFRLPEPARFDLLLLPNQSPVKTGLQQISFYPQGSATAAVIQICHEDALISVRIYPQTAKIELLQGPAEALPMEQWETPSVRETGSGTATP